MKSRRTKTESPLHYNGGQVLKLPLGRPVSESQASVADLLQQYGQNFKGSINVYKAGHGLNSNGYIMVDNGTVLAAAYTMLSITLYQLSAMDRMMSLASTSSEIVAMEDDEIQSFLNEYPNATIVAGIGDNTEKGATTEASSQEVLATPVPESVTVITVSEPFNQGGFEQLVASFTALPGVIGSALVADGFPIYQHGSDVDFEHVAAATEDMVRAGTRIATELQLGETGQIILETPEYKVIIAPIKDMFICVLTRSDTNLGLIRLNISNVQRSQGG